MLLKNWKDHCQRKHAMSLSEENLGKEYEKLKQIAISSSCSSKTATTVSSNGCFRINGPLSIFTISREHFDQY